MSQYQLAEGVYWVGAKDWTMRNFHGYQTQRGTSYNCYLLMDEKITLIDTVKENHFEQMIERIRAIIDPSLIDYVVMNHCEPDHSGALAKFVQMYPNVQIVINKKGEKILRRHFNCDAFRFRLVNTGDFLNLGKRNLKFVTIPMVHWPDSMVSYLVEERILFSNDAFGQHIASEYLLDEDCPIDVIYEEAAKYYANIVWPYPGPVKKAYEQVATLKMDLIAPSHGIIWKKHISDILERYVFWASGVCKTKAVIVYDSMWGSTEKMAVRIKQCFEDADIPVVLRSLKHSHISDIVNDLLEAKYVAVGSPTLNNTMLPTVGMLMTYIKGLKPSNKVAMVFGSYGWNNMALKEIVDILQILKWSMPVAPVSVEYNPDFDDLERLVGSVKELIATSK